ncbi:ADP-ribosylation factor-related protein [Tieghemostelium lacteum]|uniref:ADP-ribosylation factor-related protein n=1 Tax=Tieghemostelium lacteum TaxID=361077 RepID=A0A151ZIY2_TIELA|nr:ADP-ribosylation factor-related protein [Tieghemostelium lacteum]|eukprot:KYQ93951.1 ADP-ribosylation factor-related protein [Tieghemostelium lacteum]
MGALYSKVFTYFYFRSWSPIPFSVLLIGPDGAGKTTLLYKLKLGNITPTAPTIGFNLENVQIGDKLNLTIWDVGGDSKIRYLWKHYFNNNLNAVIFMIDISDRSRINEVLESAFYPYVVNDELLATNIPLLILANKEDQLNSMTIDELKSIFKTSKSINNKYLKFLIGKPIDTFKRYLKNGQFILNIRN